MSEIIIIDPRQSGISGDMLISALTDFFDCHSFTNDILNKILDSSNSLYSTDAFYSVEKVTKNHIYGTSLNFSVKSDFPRLNVQQFIDNWKNILENLDSPNKVKDIIFNTLNLIISAEKIVHGKQEASLEEIHFHELNSIDTIIDITTTVYILHKFNFPTLHGLSTAIGDTPISFSHGTFAIGPAVARILEDSGYYFISKKANFELTTPTGLANLISIIDKENFKHNFPSGQIIKSGIGLGQKQEKGYPNFLKIWKIKENDINYTNDASMQILETNVDDVSGELLGNVIETYSTIEGIKDISMYPLIMKKNRPGHCIRILLDPRIINVDTLSTKLMKDIGTLGVRYYPVSRHKTVREIINYEYMQEKIRIKVSKLENGLIINIKPEYDDLNSLSKKLGQSVRELSQMIIESYKKGIKE